jgi:iron-sulfur cluster repair protein YtfE (RIC family)
MDGPSQQPMPPNGAATAGAPEASACAHADAFGILQHCHEHIGQRLDLLETLVAALRSRGSFDEELLAGLGDVVTFLDIAIPIHTADEEQTLFPLLRQHPEFQQLTNTPMDCMELEHHAHVDLRRALIVSIVRRDPLAVAEAGLDLVRSYREHIRKEEEVLYPLARKLLTDPAALSWMTAEMRARRKTAGLLTC